MPDLKLNKIINMDLNFTITELVHSDNAKRVGIDNTPSIKEIDNLLYLIFYILQPVRNKFGAIKVTSGYRNNKVNFLAGGAVNSNHLGGFAADIIPLKATFKQLYDFIVQHLDFDECFIEKNSLGAKWLHVAYRHNNNRKKHNPNYLA